MTACSTPQTLKIKTTKIATKQQTFSLPVGLSQPDVKLQVITKAITEKMNKDIDLNRAQPYALYCYPSSDLIQKGKYSRDIARYVLELLAVTEAYKEQVKNNNSSINQ